MTTKHDHDQDGTAIQQRDRWDNVAPLEETDTRDVYIVSVADAGDDSLAKSKTDAYLAFSDGNAKYQAFHAVKGSYTEPRVYSCERVAEDV